MRKDYISVALATYNGERFLREQLDSLYKQTRVPDEVFVSDDCSQDNTVHILEEYHQKYGLRYSINDHSIGVNKNFEHAIRSCTGNYIMICDQDDIWFLNKIELTFNKLKSIEDDKPAMVSSQCYHIDKDNKIISKKTVIKNDSYGCAETLLQPAGVTQGCTLMFNRKLLNIIHSFPSEDICYYDCYIGFICAIVGNKYNMSTPLMYYRHHDNNVLGRISSKKNTLAIKSVRFLKNIINPTCIPPDRLKCIERIESEYGSVFSDSVMIICNKLKSYINSKTRVGRIKWCLKMNELSFPKRMSLLWGCLLYIFQK